MFRASLSRATRPVAFSAVRSSRWILPQTQGVRFNSTEQPPAGTGGRKKAAPMLPNAQKDWDGRIMKYEELKGRTLRPSPDKYLIDVREPDEVIQGMIPSAVNLPLSILGEALNTPAEYFKEKHGFEKPRKSQEVVFYCRSGKRSASACDIAKRNSFTNIWNYEGSWLEWVSKEGKPN